MADEDEKYVWISNDVQLGDLVDQINRGELFGEQFKFTERSLFLDLLEKLHIDYEEFIKTYFHIDHGRNLHIAESGCEYVWISTCGLIARNKATSNKAVNACINQYTVISHLLEKAIEVSQSETVYDVDSYDFGYLSELSPALFHNIIFYVEVFCKAYLNLNGIKPGNTHKLSSVYSKTLETMKSKKHNDSIFQVRILDPLFKFVDHVNSIPGNFKEQFIKYDDNPDDNTVIIFQTVRLNEVKIIFELSRDFITDYFHNGEETFYLKSGLYQRLLDKAEKEEDRNKIRHMYSHLKDDQLNKNTYQGI